MIGKSENSAFLNTSMIRKSGPNTIFNYKDGKLPSYLLEEFELDLKQAINKTINFVHFCSFESAPDILACCVQENIFIYGISWLNKNDGVSTKCETKFISDYICGSKCTTLTLGPKTNFSGQSGYISLAVATDDFNIFLVNQVINLENENANPATTTTAEQQFFSGHINFINDLAFDPISGEQLASVGDDCTCIIRSLISNLSEESNSKIMLSSPGVSVKWHKTEPNKLFVAEKKGLIRFYDVVTKVAVQSFDCYQYPLTSSDWCLENHFLIGCASDKDLFFWDTSITSLPIKVMRTNLEGLLEFSFYDSKTIAYRGRPNNLLCVKNLQTNQTYFEKEFMAGTGMSWNRNQSVLAVGGPKYVHLYKFNFP